MTSVICYMLRTQRGLLPHELVMISHDRLDRWMFPSIQSDDRDELLAGIKAAATWAAGRAGELNAGTIDAFVLDADGTLCSWLASPSQDPQAIAALLRQAAMSQGDDAQHAAIESIPHLAINPDLQLPSGVTIEPLTPDIAPQERYTSSDQNDTHGQRLGVITVNDATARIFLDELDEAGVEVHRISTIFHAMVAVLDSANPTRGASVHSSDILEDQTVTTTAQILLDHDAGKLLWTWAQHGRLVAAGAHRLITKVSPASERDHSRQPAHTHVQLEQADLAQLAAAWIAWATQLGYSPAKIRVLLPEDAWHATDDQSLGQALAAIWPHATLDIVFEDNPVEVVLERYNRLCGSAHASNQQAAPACAASRLRTLEERPSKQHRSMYHWSALAITAAALGMGVFAWQTHRASKAALEQAQSIRTQWRDIARDIMPASAKGQKAQPSFDSIVIQDLQSELAKRTAAVAPIKIEPEKPILQELETLSFVLGNPDYKLEQLSITPLGVMMTLTVPDTAAYEDLAAALNHISGSSIGKWTPKIIRNYRNTRTGQNTGLRCSFDGSWKANASATTPSSTPPAGSGDGQS